MTITKLEEIDAWKLGRELTRAVCRLSKGRKFERDFSLRDQIRSAAVSITSDIAAGFERGSTHAFLPALDVAKDSAGKVPFQLHVALDERYLDLKTSR